ncbi:TetM/TetW/TetO/TetS family tetracycline resistance ribosomal protection protein [Paenibacillus sp. VCA1]|uniref:TetM/TetW/TetO/TetS family tetracycline resistance ribosomal protection protein n=1 Tax=Paenibacillus sp. VCA1 TaxID=3039148 RepID=UPI0028717CBE|nr:TetM/TetW/TetO/TetS family tetracycline resistance ribosomal protection protein [Paenibacillus sp. VCA1]MDR9854217.1 TetM/TetW/TetO/TetS family tetracycline resistance ribosomal protection protein [Paenibacillus sp. VCA1]
MKIINIGVLAHVDAGKTTLTEQILYQSGVKSRAGSVDRGDTTTDSLDIERRRGITVKSAAVSFWVGDELKVNLIDTPGHADFISEVEHSLSVLDGVILVISAVEGVQAQTRVLMQTLKQLGMPTLLFMNKIDRMGADYAKVRNMIRSLLDEHICEMNIVENEGCEEVRLQEADPLSARWLETLAAHDDELLRLYAEDVPLTSERLHKELIQQTKDGKAFPLFAGSAAKGMGVKHLLDCLGDFIPSNAATGSKPAEDRPLSGIVFKVVKDRAGERAAFIRLFAGQLRLRDEVQVISRNGPERMLKVKQLQFLQGDKRTAASLVSAGDIAVMTSAELFVGDVIGVRSGRIRDFAFHKPPIQVNVLAEHAQDPTALSHALSALTIEDPFLEYQHDQNTQEHTIRVFGKVQQEVLAETIWEEYGIRVSFSPPRVMCIEKPVACGKSAEFIGEAGNPFWATVGFRVEPGPAGSGLTYNLEVELGSLPLSFQKAIQETVAETLNEGLYGWPVTDITVTLTHTGYASPVSTAKDFRRLVPLVLMDALSRAGTVVYEPVGSARMILPENSLSKVLSRLAQLEGTFQEPDFQGKVAHLNATIPVRTADTLKAELHSLTNGEGMLSIKPVGYAKVRSVFPENERRQLNPLNRGEYLLRLNKIME